ncbi:MAG TPA: PQQ-binding-like beta-propeller repeat protein, partial [Planctomycetota bacterium]|nr:PQQ-binding-like beta-propeller repeat protein [Planctomycetota bacterium]
DAPAASPEWPMAHGPFGNFTPRRWGHRLVEDLRRARRLWLSEDNDLGYGKGSASGYVAVLFKRPAHPGSCSGPIVADQRIFSSSFRPSGSVWAENLPHLKNMKTPLRDEELRKLQQELRLEADDLVLAVDRRTGRTVWKAVEERKGVNRYMGKRLGFGVAPVWFAGRVFALGTTGRLYAYDAADGRKLWETDIGKAHRAAEERKRRCLESKNLPGSWGWNSSLIAADGVLVAPAFDDPRAMGLLGIDPDTGRRLWERPGVNSPYATPALFQTEGRSCLLTATLGGAMHLISPRDGKVLWTVQGLAPNYASLVCSAEHVFAYVDSAMKDRLGRTFARLAAFRVTPSRAEPAWTLPDRSELLLANWMDCAAHRCTAVRDGRVYLYARHDGLDGADGRHLAVVEEKTGEVLHVEENPWEGSLLSVVEDRLLHWKDAVHHDEDEIEMFRADPADFRKLGSPWKPAESAATGYEVYMEVPYADGCLFFRTVTGHLSCYDLRA